MPPKQLFQTGEAGIHPLALFITDRQFGGKS
jgi:hypothetical protein